jgi:hypothetical protein
MSDLFLLSERQLTRIVPHFPQSHGVKRVDDRRVNSGIIFVIRTGFNGKAHQKPMARTRPYIIGSHTGACSRVQPKLHGPGQAGCLVAATHLKAHRVAASLAQNGFLRYLGRTKSGLNSRLHAVCDEAGKPILLYLTAGWVGGHNGAHALPPAGKNEKLPFDYDKTLCRRSHKVESMFAKLKG